MPPLSRWFVKAALLHFALAVSLLGWLQTSFGPAGALAAGLRLAALHLLVVGWVSQLIVGVAHWMFPPLPRDRRHRRGHPLPPTLAFGLLNAGLLLRLVAEPALRSGAARGPWPWLLASSAAAQWLAVLLLVVHLWPRVRGRSGGHA